MQPGTAAYGDGLTKYFRVDMSSHLVTSTLRKSKLAVTRVRRDTPGHGMTSPLPAEPAFSVLLHLRDCPNREVFMRGRSVFRGAYGARTTSIVDLEHEPTANLESPFGAVHFYVSRSALKEIADDQGAQRIDTLACERGVFNPTVWHLGEALLPALAQPRNRSHVCRSPAHGDAHLFRLRLRRHAYRVIAGEEAWRLGRSAAPPSS
jgi:AraC family transcriptional regulator